MAQSWSSPSGVADADGEGYFIGTSIIDVVPEDPTDPAGTII